MELIIIIVFIILVVMMASAMIILQKPVAALAVGSINGGGSLTKINWPAPRILKPEIVKTAMHLLRKKPGFNVLKLDEAKSVIYDLNAKYGESNCITETGQVMSLYRGVKTVAYAHAVTSSSHRHSQIDAMLWKMPVTDVATNLNIPLLVVLRRAFTLNGMSHNNVHNVLNGTIDPPSGLKEATVIALKNDINSTPNMKEIQHHAEEFEREVEKQLVKLGVRFLNENALRDINYMFTPDFLIGNDESLQINGNPINWIEVKNYPGVEIPGSFISKKIQQQAAKYTKHYGPGAFVFNGGIAEGFDLKTPVMLLDFNFLIKNSIKN